MEMILSLFFSLCITMYEDYYNGFMAWLKYYLAFTSNLSMFA